MHVELAERPARSKASDHPTPTTVLIEHSSVSSQPSSSQQALVLRPYDPKQKAMTFWRRHGRLTTAAALACCFFLLLLTSSHAFGGSSAKQPPKELYECINNGQPEQQLTTYEDFAYQKPAR